MNQSNLLSVMAGGHDPVAGRGSRPVSLPAGTRTGRAALAAQDVRIVGQERAGAVRGQVVGLLEHVLRLVQRGDERPPVGAELLVALMDRGAELGSRGG